MRRTTRRSYGVATVGTAGLLGATYAASQLGEPASEVAGAAGAACGVLAAAGFVRGALAARRPRRPRPMTSDTVRDPRLSWTAGFWIGY